MKNLFCRTQSLGNSSSPSASPSLSLRTSSLRRLRALSFRTVSLRAVSVFCCSVALPALVLAENNVGSCGWGSKLFDGQKGIAPQSLAVTTNGSSGNQTFAISSGTSGCTQDGVVRSSWQTAAFIDSNMNRLALDMSRGEGEHLRALSSLLQMTEGEAALFASSSKERFQDLFASPKMRSDEFMAQLARHFENTPGLESFAVHVS